MKNTFTTAELQALSQLESQFDIQALTDQLQTVIATADPIGYMESNINWEIERLQAPQEGKSLAFIDGFALPAKGAQAAFVTWHPFRRFIEWFKRNFTSQKVKKALCSVVDKIEKLIDADAELKLIIQAALVALAAVAGLVINPVVLTLMVGILAMMILKGVNNVCGI